MVQPTPYATLNVVLHTLTAQVQHVLGDTCIGVYLQGSFAIGDFDEHSDVDFLVAVEAEPVPAQEAALQAMHAELYRLDTPWAQHLEGSYVPRTVLRRYSPPPRQLLYLDNTSSALVRSSHDDSQVVRWVVRERGITLAGPPPQSLIELVAANDLRQEIVATMESWGAELMISTRMNNRWYQPFAVLSYCRMLHSLDTGIIDSKLAGANWARKALDGRWAGLIERAWLERPDPSAKVRQPADPADLAQTLQFIAYALDRGTHVMQGLAGNE